MKQAGRHKEFDRRFAERLGAALEEFAARKKMTPDEIFDGGDNLMSEFANWAKKKLGLNIDQYMPSAEEFVEGSGSNPVDEYFIRNWIAEELEECEWVDPSEIEYSGEEPWVEVTAPNGVVYRIQVTKEFAPREVSAFDDAI
jgi:hypothetical protein